jgi:hypothetical protein
MCSVPARFRKLYGAHPLHLLLMLAAFSLLGYIVVTATPSALRKPEGAWWQSIVIWFIAAFVAHDLVLFPLYALVDRLLGPISVPRRQRRREPITLVRNYLRVPTLGSGLLLLIFFPGIIKQGAQLYFDDTGLTQQPFLGRWLLFTAVMFGVSGASYAARVAMTRRCDRTMQ